MKGVQAGGEPQAHVRVLPGQGAKCGRGLGRRKMNMEEYTICITIGTPSAEPSEPHHDQHSVKESDNHHRICEETDHQTTGVVRSTPSETSQRHDQNQTSGTKRPGEAEEIEDEILPETEITRGVMISL